jgi:ribosomal protein L37AE/L43A
MGGAAMSASPWCDVTLCPSCEGPTVLRREHQRGEDYPLDVSLVCLSCGNGFAGTAEQVARNEHAADAWQVEKIRQALVDIRRARP